MKSPEEIINLMLAEDTFSNALGIIVNKIEKGASEVALTVTKKHVNGFNITHGGVPYSLADTAVAFAANAHGFKAVSIENSISYVKPSFLNNKLIASCAELHRGKTIGRYSVEIKNEENILIALFKSTIHFSKDCW